VQDGVEVAEPGVRALGEGAEESVVLGSPALGGRGLEQVEVVLQGPAQALVGVLESQRQVELRAPAGEVEPTHREARELDALLDRVGEECLDLEQRRVAEAALDPERVHQPLEGDVPVAEGPERGLADPAQKLGHGGVAGEVGAQRHLVDEEADQALALQPFAVRHVGAHQHVASPGHVRQEDLEGGDGGHEQGRAVAPAEGAQGVGGLGR
jgi:hypothetical protein